MRVWPLSYTILFDLYTSAQTYAGFLLYG